MLFSKDFLTYFAAMAPLLEQDPTIWCISTWNDNGLAHFDWHNDGLVSPASSSATGLQAANVSGTNQFHLYFAVSDVLFPGSGMDAAPPTVGGAGPKIPSAGLGPLDATGRCLKG